MTRKLLLDMLEVAAISTAYLAAAIILSGLISGIVSLGIVQTFARERLQRRGLEAFFTGIAEVETQGHAGKPDSGDTSQADPGPSAGSEPMAGGRVRQVAALLGLPEPTLCRLYYRQVAGQFLAAINSEAAGDGKTPLLDLLTTARKDATSRDRLHEAARRVDALQAQLADAVDRPVMKGMLLVWTPFYLYLAAVASSELAGEIALRLPGDSRVADVVAAVSATLIMVVPTILLAVSAAASGMLAFSWLDRLVAPK